MLRKRNTGRNGQRFSDYVISQVWMKGRKISGYDSNVWRSDICGNAMKRSEYGNTNSKYGWEIDHIKPIVLGGGDELSNLQPLHWENNRRKGDTYPWYCQKDSKVLVYPGKTERVTRLPK